MATRLYRPSSGTAGDAFSARFCNRCIHDVDETCEILTRTLVFRIDEPEYPVEWVQDDVPFPVDSHPRCTAFINMNGLRLAPYGI